MAPPNPRILPYGPAAIDMAAALIRDGGIVAVPTETVYGLAADATNAVAVARIYDAKGRPSFNPLIVHVLDVAAAERIAVFDDDARALAAAFWPGPLTLVLSLRADAGIASLVTAGLDTIAIRIPAHRAMRALLAACGKPLSAPSANASGGISPTRATHVAASLGARAPLIIDDGATEVGLESTIVTGRTVLRPGPITDDMLQKSFLGESRGPARIASVTGFRRSPGKPMVTAPGQLASHYAPAKAVRLNANNPHPDEYLIGFGSIPGDITLSKRGDLIEAATNLFDALHIADASSKRRIAVAPIPRAGIGIAINDRLSRAAHQEGVSREDREGKKDAKRIK